MLSPYPIPQPDAEQDRAAFNAAFYALGLRWHWDDLTYATLADEPCERSRVTRYLQAEQSHLLRAYDADFLVDAILQHKARHQPRLGSGPAPLLSRGGWADPRWGEVGI